jgi:hypothetical protein
MFLSWRSPLKTNRVLSLSSEPSLFTLTLKISITGVLISPSYGLSATKVLVSTNVLSSFLTDFNHSCCTVPSGIFSISCILLGAGSHDTTSVVVGTAGIASIAHARARSWQLEPILSFSHSYPLAILAYLGLGLRARAEHSSPAGSTIDCGEILAGSGLAGVSRSSISLSSISESQSYSAVLSSS